MDAAIVHWAILFFRIPLFQSLREWFWPFTDKALPHLWLALPLAAVALAVVLIAFRWPGRIARNLALIVVLAWANSMTFALMEGRGMEPLSERLAKTGHAEFALMAAVYHDFGIVARHYEEILTAGARPPVYSQTKPPGTLLFSMAIERCANFITPANTLQNRFDHLIRFAGFAYPIIAALAVLPLFFFARAIAGESVAYAASLLYIFAPNVALIAMELDQVLLSTLFVTCLYLAERAGRGRPLVWSAMAGLASYLAIYVSFSMLPVIPICLALFLAAWALDPNANRAAIALRSLGGFVFGFALAYAAMRLAFDYDPYSRYRAAIAFHEKWKKWTPGLGNVIYFAFVNYIEFASWIGFPLTLLFFVFVFRASADLSKRRPSKAGFLALSVVAVLVLLGAFGKTKSEVARLWLFLVPCVATVVAGGLAERFPAKFQKILLVLLALQFVTTILMKANQDFWVNPTPMVGFAVSN